MKQLVRSCATCLAVLSALLFLGPGHALAISIAFDPAAQDVFLGEQAMVDLVISGLGSGEAPSLSGFDLVVAYDPSILALDTASLGDPVLGDQLDLFGFGMNPSLADEFIAGEVVLFELSLDSNADLDDFQADGFVLASLRFDTLALGTSPLELPDVFIPGTDILVGPTFASTELDNLDFPIPLDVDRNAGSITVIPRGGTEPVPEPGTILLLGSGLLGLAGFRKRFG